MTAYFKAVRPDGGDFYSGTIVWAGEPGHTITHPDPIPGSTDAAHYLSVSTVETDCTGMGWPCRLLVVEPVEGHEVWAPHPDMLPHKRAAVAFRVVGELPAHRALGPMGEHVAALLTAVRALSGAELRTVAVAWDAADADTAAYAYAAADGVDAADADTAAYAYAAAAHAAGYAAHAYTYIAADAAHAAADAARALVVLHVAARDDVLHGHCETLLAPARAVPALAAVIDQAWEHAHALNSRTEDHRAAGGERPLRSDVIREEADR